MALLHVPALYDAALEQPIVMGVALVFLFVHALNESDPEDERAERYA